MRSKLDFYLRLSVKGSLFYLNRIFCHMDANNVLISNTRTAEPGILIKIAVESFCYKKTRISSVKFNNKVNTNIIIIDEGESLSRAKDKIVFFQFTS